MNERVKQDIRPSADDMMSEACDLFAGRGEGLRNDLYLYMPCVCVCVGVGVCVRVYSKCQPFHCVPKINLYCGM